MRIHANAKINLTLDVVNRRSDGYHDLCMVMQEITLCDELELNFDGGHNRPQLICDDPRLPTGDQNLALLAAKIFGREAGVSLEGLVIRLHKVIPIMAGLGGGSADAAAVIRGLHELNGEKKSLRTLQRMGLQVGSDVPFCIQGGIALAEGRGEVLAALPAMPSCAFVLVQPAFQVSTGALFGAVDDVKLTDRPNNLAMLEALRQKDLQQICSYLGNVFEQVLPLAEKLVVTEIKDALINLGALGACMTGTGSVVYGVFEDNQAAARAAKALQGKYPVVLTAEPTAQET